MGLARLVGNHRRKRLQAQGKKTCSHVTAIARGGREPYTTAKGCAPCLIAIYRTWLPARNSVVTPAFGESPFAHLNLHPRGGKLRGRT